MSGPRSSRNLSAPPTLIRAGNLALPGLFWALGVKPDPMVPHTWGLGHPSGFPRGVVVGIYIRINYIVIKIVQCEIFLFETSFSFYSVYTLTKILVTYGPLLIVLVTMNMIYKDLCKISSIPSNVLRPNRAVTLIPFTICLVKSYRKNCNYFVKATG